MLLPRYCHCAEVVVRLTRTCICRSYTFVFGIEYFDTLCALSLYIVMAVGADDVFIWFDAYEQSAFESREVSATLES
eukprot:COSAG01_NODE_67746_length_266_cov_0.616766_1_plen_76_part_01